MRGHRRCLALVPAQAYVPALARAFLQEVLNRHGLDGRAGSLLPSELVSNVVERARTEFSVRMKVSAAVGRVDLRVLSRPGRGRGDLEPVAKTC